MSNQSFHWHTCKKRQKTNGKKIKENNTKSKKKLFSKKHRKPIEKSLSSSDDSKIPYEDESDYDTENEYVHVDDYVVILVSGKSRALKYIACVDEVDEVDDELMNTKVLFYT